MVERIGRVIIKRVGEGTKSEREAVVIVTESGEYLLRRRGGHPFLDPELEQLVGKSILAHGIITSGQLIMFDWEDRSAPGAAL